MPGFIKAGYGPELTLITRRRTRGDHESDRYEALRQLPYAGFAEVSEKTVMPHDHRSLKLLLEQQHSHSYLQSDAR